MVPFLFSSGFFLFWDKASAVVPEKKNEKKRYSTGNVELNNERVTEYVQVVTLLRYQRAGDLTSALQYVYMEGRGVGSSPAYYFPYKI